MREGTALANMDLLKRLLRKIGAGGASTGSGSLRTGGRGNPKSGSAGNSEAPRWKTFHDIPVVPGYVFNNIPPKCVGGPIWPDFANQKLIRHRHTKRCADVEPPLPEGPLPTMPGEFVWGGQLFYHFGHFVAETCPRLDMALQKWPDLPYLFMVRPNHDPDHPPGFVWSGFDWIGLAPSQVKFVLAPARVETLHVVPQPEWLRGPPAGNFYLSLLEARAKQNGLVPVHSEALYVSRIGQIAAGGGGHAGEGYLEQALRDVGVSVMEPGSVPLREQLARYAGARTLVFAEGSAVHGRQLLGRIDQTVAILERRPGNAFAKTAMECRTRQTLHIKAARVSSPMRDASGLLIEALALSLYDVPMLLGGLESIGIDIRSRWNARAYAEARDRDIALFVSRLYLDPESYVVEESFNRLQSALDEEGLKLPSRQVALATTLG